MESRIPARLGTNRLEFKISYLLIRGCSDEQPLFLRHNTRNKFTGNICQAISAPQMLIR